MAFEVEVGVELLADWADCLSCGRSSSSGVSGLSMMDCI